MSLTLAAADTITGVAGSATAITFTIFGDEISTGADAFKVLAQGQLPASVGTLYTVPASTATIVKNIHLVNGTGGSVTARLNVKGTAAANAILPAISILAGGFAIFGDDGWSAYNDQGQRLGVGATGATGAAGALTVKDEGTPLATDATSLDFVGAGVVASGAGAAKIITIAGGAGLADQGAFTYLDGTDAAAPANPSAGYARVYSKSGRIYSRDSGGVEYGPFDAAGGGTGRALVDPTGLSWSWLNQSGASISTVGATLVLHDVIDGADSWKLRIKAMPSRPYSVIVHWLQGYAHYNYSGIAVGWLDSTTNKFAGFGNYWNSVLRWNSFIANPYSVYANYREDTTGVYPIADPCDQWVKLTDDGATRKIYLGLDGNTWYQWDSRAYNSDMTPDRLFFGIESRNGAAASDLTIDSWEEGA